MIQAAWLTQALSVLEREVATQPSGAGGLVNNNNDDFGPESFLRLMNDWRGLTARVAACVLSAPPSFISTYRKSLVRPPITARISQNENEWALHWNLEKNAVTIVCGHRAIVGFFPGTFPAFSLVLFLASLCSWRYGQRSWP